MPDGLHIGRVVGVAGAFVTVTVRSLVPDRRYGPLEGLVGTALDVGDRVLIGLLGGRQDDLVIVRKLPEV